MRNIATLRNISVLGWPSSVPLWWAVIPTVQYLVVAWGGGWWGTWWWGTANYGGGWGAGWYISDTSFSVFAQAYTVTVGTWWAWNTTNVQNNTTNNGSNWWNSVFGGQTAVWGWGWGGGRGSSTVWNAGKNWGSGWWWGAWYAGNWIWGTATSWQWFNGVQSGSGGWWWWAWAIGVANAGWVWLSNSISWAPVTYAVWGNWWAWWGGTNSAYGSWWAALFPSLWSAWVNGVVIIAYATDWSDWVSATSTGWTITTSWANTIHTFTISGTFTCVLS